MFNNFIEKYEIVLKFLNKSFVFLFFLPANIIALIYFVVGVGLIRGYYLCSDPNVFFICQINGAPSWGKGTGTEVFLLFWVPIFFIVLYFIFIVLPANILYLPVHIRQINNGKWFIQNSDLEKYFGKKPLSKILGFSFIFLEILINIFALIYCLFYISLIFCSKS